MNCAKHQELIETSYIFCYSEWSNMPQNCYLYFYSLATQVMFSLVPRFPRLRDKIWEGPGDEAIYS